MPTILKRFIFLPTPFLIFISLLILILFGLQGKNFYESKNLEFKKNISVAKNLQKEICLSYINIISRNDDSILGVDRRGRTYDISTKGFKPEINKTYAFKVKFVKDGNIILTRMSEYPFRNLKYLFSSLSIFLVSYLIISFIRFDSSEISLYIKTTGKGEQ